VERTVELGASNFLTKKPGFKELVDLVKEQGTPASGSLWTLAPIEQRAIWKAAVRRDYLGA
jgi:hypothetical protein